MISKKTKYALIALLNLTRNKDKGPLLIGNIAQEENIPKKFLESILLDLKRAGILNSKTGKGGGYYLRKDPNEVNMADVMRVFDGAIALIPCATYRFYERCDECPDEDLCSIRLAFQEVRHASVRIFKSYTLTHLLDKEAYLKEIL